MVTNIGIYGDNPRMPTGFATVLRNLTMQLIKYSDLRVIFFGRYGQKKGFAKDTSVSDYPFEYVPCQGGTWNPRLIFDSIKYYKLDAIFSEDDWWSATGLTFGANKHKIPLHFLVPIDSLPISPLAYDTFAKCEKIYVPNRSYDVINKHVKQFQTKGKKVSKKARIEAIHLPHGVDTRMFRPLGRKKSDDFTFVLIGHDEARKALGRAILAFEKIQNKYDTKLLIRTNWGFPNAKRTLSYLKKKEIKFIQETKYGCPHSHLARTYNSGDVLLCPSKAGAFEMQIIEAMACGKPALVTDWTFMNEHVINGRNGFKVPCEDWKSSSYGGIWGNISIDRLSAIMEWCINNQQLIRHMGLWARNYVMEHYKWKDCAKDLYTSIVNSIDE